MTTAIADRQETQVGRPLHVLAPLIKKDLDAGQEASERAGLPYYRSAGEKLVEARDQIKRDDWAKWVDRNFHISTRQALRYMALAENVAKATIGRARQFESLRDFERQTTGSQSTGKSSWHEPVKEAIERAANIRNLHEESLKREAEREAQKKLALQLIDIGFKALASQLHPDKGGSKEAMSRLNAVRDRLKMHA